MDLLIQQSLKSVFLSPGSLKFAKLLKYKLFAAIRNATVSVYPDSHTTGLSTSVLHDDRIKNALINSHMQI